MKKFTTLFFSLLLVASVALAQQSPKGMKYQAVARDKSGEIIANKKIGLRISLLGGLKGSTIYYSEVHELATNPYGLFDLVIGEGKVETGQYNVVPWSSEDIWMQVSIRDQQNSAFTTISNSRLLAVPYAFHAATASQLVGGSSTTELQSNAATNGVPAQVWSLKGNSRTSPETDKIGTTDAADLVFITNNLERLRIQKNGDIDIKNSLKVGQDVEVGNDLTVKKNVRLNTEGGTTENNGSFTVKNNSATLLTGKLDVDGASTLNNTLLVKGATTLESTLNVKGASSLENTLTVDGATNLNHTLSVNNNNATALSGTLNVTGATQLDNTLTVQGNTALNSTLSVNNTKPTTLSGTLTVGQTSALNGQVTISSTLPNDQDNYANYPLRVQGSQQGIAIKLSPSSPNENNNYISFWNGSGVAKGRIEGQTGLTGIARNIISDMVDKPSLGDAFDANTSTDQSTATVPATAAQYFGSNYAFGALSLTLDFVADIIRLATNIVGAGGTACLLGDCDDIIWSAVDVLVGGIQLGGYIASNEINLGVAYESGGADYAEWLPKAVLTETMTFGDVVGVKGGIISKSFKEAEKFMIVSRSPVIIGGMPDVDKEQQFEKIAFMGQVPVKVVGEAHKGDYILPTGNGDGMAMAVDPAKMKANDYKRIIGIAWAESDGSKVFNYINTAVGINSNDMAGMMEHMQLVLNNMQVALKKVVPDYKPTMYSIDKRVAISTKGYSTSPSLNEITRSKVGITKATSPKEAMQQVKEYASAQGVDLKQYPLINELLDNPTPEMAQKVYEHYSKSLVKIQKTMADMQQHKAGS